VSVEKVQKAAGIEPIAATRKIRAHSWYIYKFSISCLQVQVLHSVFIQVTLLVLPKLGLTTFN
jgi:hypothetical protein